MQDRAGGDHLPGVLVYGGGGGAGQGLKISRELYEIEKIYFPELLSGRALLSFIHSLILSFNLSFK